MKREIGIDQITHDVSSVVTVGTYDGVHRGHQAVLNYVQERAQERDASSVVVSFDPHPRSVVRNEKVPLLTTPDERADILEELGIDRFVLVRFNEAFSQIEPRDYVERFLVQKVGLQEIIIGYDHRFGKDRQGDRALLESLGAELNFDVDVLPAQTLNASQVVSSSEIRTLLMDEGRVGDAAQMLGRSYSLSGNVIEGDRRGREIGFPTANLALPDGRKVVPSNGVYAVKTHLESGEWLPGMMNIGVRPTFGPDERHLEVHVLDFNGNLYGQVVRVEFIRRLRDEQRFDGPDDLKKQLSEDRRRCKRVFQASA